MKKIFSRILSSCKGWVDLIYPDTCMACGDGLVSGEEWICLYCLMKLPETHMKNKPEENIIMDKFLGKVQITGALSAFWFDKGGILQPIVHALKYKGKKDLGLRMGRVMGGLIQESYWKHQVNFLVPVPLHPSRKRRRGYNQAEVLAQGIAEVSGIQLKTNLLVRTSNNITQTGKSKEARWDNVKEIFSCTEQVSGGIMIVDDVITTGSTLEACISALNTSGNSNVWVICLGAAR